MFLGNFTAFFLQTLFMFAAEEDRTNELKNDEVQDTEATVAPTRCFDRYGCISLTAPFVTEDRPIDLFPQAPKILNVTLCLYTRQRQNDCQILNIDSKRNREIHMNPSFKIKIITHGYLEHGREAWIMRLKNKILQVMNETYVVVLDWEGGASPPYSQAVADLRLVGIIAASYLWMLHETFKINTENVHFIGHSLGAHLAGYAGTELRKMDMLLGRVTGMDPAGPHFEGTDPLVKLDYTDAKFVDIIHTDASLIIGGGLGIVEPTGHLDFYPNGGEDQPNCTSSVTDVIEEQNCVFDGIKQYLGCDHLRVIDYFVESIDNQCQFIGHLCTDWQSYLNGDCSSCSEDASACATMGMYSDAYTITDTQPVRFNSMYLKTSNAEPFCSRQYIFTIQISTDEANITHRSDVGFLNATLYGSDGQSSHEVRINSEETEFAPGSQFSWVIAADIDPPLSSVLLKFEAGSSMLNPLTWGIIGNRHLHIQRIDIRNMADDYRVKMCGKSSVLSSGSALKLYQSADCPGNGTTPH